MKKSLKWIKKLSLVKRRLDKTCAELYCWKMEQQKLDLTEDDKEALWEADELLRQAVFKVDLVFKGHIANEIMSEINRGEWDKEGKV